MPRRLLIAACLLAISLAAAPTADAARKAPNGFFGTVFDGPIKSAAPTLIDSEFGRMTSAGVQSARTNFAWGDIQPARGTTTFAKTDALVRGRRPNTARSCCPWSPRLRLGAQVPGQGGLPAQAGVGVHRSAYRARGPLRAERQLLGREPDGSEAPDPQLADLERAEPALPVGPGRGPGLQEGGARLRQAPEGLAKAAPEGRPGIQGRVGRAHQLLLEGPGHPVRARPHQRRLRRGGRERLLEPSRRLHQDREGGPGGAQQQRGPQVPIWITEFTAPAAKGRVQVPVYQRRFITTDAQMAKVVKATYTHSPRRAAA